MLYSVRTIRCEISAGIEIDLSVPAPAYLARDFRCICGNSWWNIRFYVTENMKYSIIYWKFPFIFGIIQLDFRVCSVQMNCVTIT